MINCQLSCDTCGRSTYAPWRHYDANGKLTEACCDLSHEPYLHHVGNEYREHFYRFWRAADAKVAGTRARVPA